MIEVIVGGRQTGRTKRLIHLNYEAEKRGEASYIVCSSQREAQRIFRLAIELQQPIPFPITYLEYVNGAYAGKNIRGFYIDNAELLLQMISHVPIKAMTITKEVSDD